MALKVCVCVCVCVFKRWHDITPMYMITSPLFSLRPSALSYTHTELLHPRAHTYSLIHTYTHTPKTVLHDDEEDEDNKWQSVKPMYSDEFSIKKKKPDEW